MNQQQALSHVDHTQLKPCSTWADIQKVCQESLTFATATVCIPASYVKQAHETYGDKLNICTVVGFPLGYSTTAAKVAETLEAIECGASEVDMVVNLGWVKDGLYDLVTQEIATIKAACGGHILKVIIEACYLSEEEKIALCDCVTKGGADYIKTSTGFGSGGATLEDIRLFKQHIGSKVKIKAAGGIRTKEEIESYLNEGVERVGASSAIKAYE